MARLKTLYRSSRTSSFGMRFFSTHMLPTNSNWDKISPSQRIDYALSIENPTHPEIAYLKGLGLDSFGPEYADQAIKALEKALSLSNGSHWAASCKLAEIYNNLGLEHQSFNTIFKAQRALNELFKSDQYVKEISHIKQNLEDSEFQTNGIAFTKQ